MALSSSVVNLWLRSIPSLNDAQRNQHSSVIELNLAQNQNEELLPPQNEVVEACRVFMGYYFQLGFLPTTIFLNRLEKEIESMNFFLLLYILRISARFTASLVKNYGGHAKATKAFIERAERSVAVEIYNLTLESIQGFLLLRSAE